MPRRGRPLIGLCVVKDKRTNKYVTSKSRYILDAEPFTTDDIQKARVFQNSIGAVNMKFDNVHFNENKTWRVIPFDELYEIVPIEIKIKT